MGNQSLVLQVKESHSDDEFALDIIKLTFICQSLGRANSGDYSCLASNSIGKGISAPLKLDIKCKYRFFFSITNQ